MKTAKDVLKAIKDNDVKYVDLRFTDPRGKWQHVTFDQSLIDEDVFAEGMMFDGSSIAGWKAINESDMTLMPDPTTALHGPVLRRLDAVDHLRHARADDRRALRPRPARHRQEGREPISSRPASATRPTSAPRPSSSCSTTCASRPTRTTPASQLDSIELPTNTRHRLRRRQPRPPHPHQGRLFPGAADRLGAGHARRDARGHGARWASRSRSTTTKSPPPQHELGLKFGTLTTMADHMQVYKYCIHKVAQSYGKTATFMPKPIYRRQRLGHARAPVDLEGRQAAVRRQQIRRPLAGMPLLHRRHHQARQGAQRLHQPVDQQLQAPRAGLRGAGAARLFGAQPLGLVPHPVHVEPEGQARRGALPRSRAPIPISPSRRC